MTNKDSKNIIFLLSAILIMLLSINTILIKLNGVNQTREVSKFRGVSTAATPCWVGINEGDIYIWQYNNHSAAAAGAWTADGVSLLTLGALGLWCGPLSEDMAGYGIPGNMTHEINSVGDLGPDLEYLSNYQSVEIIHAMTWNYSGGSDALGGGSGGYPWIDKITGTNVWNGLILENATEFALWHSDLTLFFDAFAWTTTSMWVNTNLNWSEVVATANIGLAAVNATAAVETDGSEEIGFKITIAASEWGTNTLAIGLTVTFDECGLLDTWDLTYGTDTIMDVTQIVGAEGKDFLPNVVVQSPLNNTYWAEPPLIKVSTPDVNVDKIWYNISGIPINEFLENNTAEYLNGTIWGNIPQGMFEINYYANDSCGNLNYTFTYTLYKDTYAPNITIHSPLNNSYWDSTPLINVSAFDGNLVDIWYTVSNNPTKEYLQNNTAEYMTATLWTNLPYGPFEIHFYATDSAGNIRNLNISLNKQVGSTNGEPEIPSYNIMIVLGIMTLVSIVFLKKRENL